MLKRRNVPTHYTLHHSPFSCDVTQQSDQTMSDAFLADTADHSPQEEARGEDTAQWATVGNKPDRNLGGQISCFGAFMVRLKVVE